MILACTALIVICFWNCVPNVVLMSHIIPENDPHLFRSLLSVGDRPVWKFHLICVIIIMKFIYGTTRIFNAPILQGTCSTSAKLFSAGKSLMIALPYAEKIRWYVKPFQYNVREHDGWIGTQTDGLNCYTNIRGFLKDFLEMHNPCLSHQSPRTWAVTRLHSL